MKKRRLSKLQRLILEELRNVKEDEIDYMTLKKNVDSKLNNKLKWNHNLMNSENCRIRENFNNTYSRSIRNLQEKGLLVINHRIKFIETKTKIVCKKCYGLE